MPHPSLPFRAATAAALLLPAPALGQQAPGAGPVASQVDTALRGVLLVAGVLVVLILVAVAVLV